MVVAACGNRLGFRMPTQWCSRVSVRRARRVDAAASRRHVSRVVIGPGARSTGRRSKPDRRVQGLVIEEAASVEGVAVARGAGGEQAADGHGWFDQVLELWQLVDCERADAVVRGSLVWPEDLADLGERESDSLGEVSWPSVCCSACGEGRVEAVDIRRLRQGCQIESALSRTSPSGRSRYVPRAIATMTPRTSHRPTCAGASGASRGSAPVGLYEYTPYSLVKSTIAWTVSGLPSSIAVPKDMM